MQRVAVVTGGAGGLGLEIVRHLHDRGMAVVSADCDRRATESGQAAFAGEPVRFLAADIGTEDGARAAIEAAIEDFGRIDLLCNNAAIHPAETIEDHALETWRETFRVNVEGAMLCSRSALAAMKRAGGGAIVNIGSISGLVPYAGGGAYAASKAALAMLTRVLALEAGPHGIRVNCICPGSIRAAAPSGERPAHIPVGRHGTPADVANMVAFLASEEASYLNGAVITLDGGATAGRAKPRRAGR